MRAARSPTAMERRIEPASEGDFSGRRRLVPFPELGASSRLPSVTFVHVGALAPGKHGND